MRRRLTLRSRGVEVIARCFDRDWRGKGGPQFLLSYTTPDGVKRTHSAGEGRVPAGTREGDSVAVLYDPMSPGRAETALASRKPFWKHYDMAGLWELPSVSCWWCTSSRVRCETAGHSRSLRTATSMVAT
ncbi:DUF3592 domain-containing protein [Streptomyces sp. NPDC102441]|uniref:DUF3592 domain-containing protein n=1 Tax=Streptomyces sp. NPDC102441 TaxID=3366176 RepID=UPI0037F6A136